MMAVSQRLHRRLDDEIRRAKIGLPDTEIDDVAALRRQRRGARQHSESVLLADPIECCDGFQHGRHLKRIAAQKQTLAPMLQRNIAGSRAMRETGFARAPDRLIYAGGEGMRRRK